MNTNRKSAPACWYHLRHLYRVLFRIGTSSLECVATKYLFAPSFSWPPSSPDLQPFLLEPHHDEDRAYHTKTELIAKIIREVDRMNTEWDTHRNGIARSRTVLHILHTFGRIYAKSTCFEKKRTISKQHLYMSPIPTFSLLLQPIP